MTASQIGYGLGVSFLVPLGDLYENKKVILSTITLTIIAQIALGFSKAVMPFLIASVLVGFGASTVQILVPYASHLYDRAERGRVIGSLMSGLMIGIMLSRPLSSLLADLISPHAVFFVSSGVMLLLLWRLSTRLPKRIPDSHGLRYHQLIWSMKDLLLRTPTLQRRAFYQALMFGAFCLFWVTVPLLLTGPMFNFTQKGVAIFALVGVAGAVVAPYAGKMADRGLGRQATLISFASGIVAFAIAMLVRHEGWAALVMLAIAANLLDAGVASHLVLGQRAIFMIDPRNQSRLNGLYVAIIYIGGSLGSALGAWAFSHWGWSGSMMAGLLFPLSSLAIVMTESWVGYQEAAD
jgi:predicted MFS family arabinose efflux permease